MGQELDLRVDENRELITGSVKGEKLKVYCAKLKYVCRLGECSMVHIAFDVYVWLCVCACVCVCVYVCVCVCVCTCVCVTGVPVSSCSRQV